MLTRQPAERNIVNLNDFITLRSKISDGRMSWPVSLVFQITISSTPKHVLYSWLSQIQLITICLTYEHQKTGQVCFSINFLNINIVEKKESSVFEAANDIDFLAP